MPGRILIVEDEQEIADLLDIYFSRAGFTVARANSIAEAARINAEFRPGLILLDIGLPDGSGMDAMAAIRSRFDTPVVMVTAMDGAASKITALRMGADDYVVKPFNPSEVVERVNAVLRRTLGIADRRTVRVGDLEIDLDSKTVRGGTTNGTNNDRLPLTPTEFEIFAHMARQPRRVFTRGELLEAVAPDSEAFDRVVDSHLSKLRGKLAAAGCSDIIEPVRGVGYRLWPDT